MTGGPQCVTDSEKPFVDGLLCSYRVATHFLPAVNVLLSALDNIKPVIGTRPIRKSGSVVRVPVALTEHRRQSLAIRWLVAAARARKEHTMPERLCNEVLAAHSHEGSAVAKKVELHKTAEANRAFAHLG
eukprot:m.141218 g.141218  ORF g.141218 m.141218 type:complete len:130 (-) comp10019_c3_seq1:170-559(-)